MSLKIIIGPASSGKSMKLARDLVKEAYKHPEKSFIALVPEQFTLQMQKRLTMLHEKHALFNVDIVSFNRLARKVFNELGEQTGQVLDDLGKTLILKRVLEECQDDMIIYKNKAHLSGFVDEIKSMITEFRQYEIGPEELNTMVADAAGNDMLQGKLQDLMLILNRFNETIAEKFLTSEDVLEKFVDLVQKSDIIKGSEIYLDGFTGFTPVQYRLIKEFLKADADVTVALTLPADRINENCPDHDLFALSNKTVKRLKRAAFEAGKAVLEYTDIANVSDEEKAGPGNADTDTEHEAEKEGLQEHSQSAGPVMYKCPCNNIKEEVNWVASEILRLVKDEGYRFREIGIVTCGLETYYEPLKETLKEAGIACFIDYKTGLLDNPLVRFIMGALEIIEDKYSFNSVFNFLKSGLGSIKQDDICLLENYCLEFGIKGTNAWHNPFEKNRKNPVSGVYAYNLDWINGLRERFIESIAPLSDSVKKSGGSVSEMCTAIMSMLEANALSEKLDGLIVSLTEKGEMETASRYDQLYEKVAVLIGKISDLMGDDKLSLKDLTGLIDIGLKEMKIGIIPPTMDTLTAGDLQRTRFDKIRALFMIGTTAGVIPRIKSGSGLLTERERNLLKKEDRELAPTAEEDLYIQRFYIYMMLHKPSEKLYITYPTSDTGGDPLKPSVILEDLDELAEGITQDQTVAEQGHNWNARGLRELSGELTGDKLNEALLNYFAVKKSPELEKILEGAFYTNKQARLNADVTARLFDGDLKGSVSRFETFSQCPYKYFLQYTLKIQPRPEYEVNNAEIGNIYHKTMELYSERVKAQDPTFRSITEADSHRITEECLNQAIADIQGQGGSLTDTSRSAFMVQNMHKVAKKTTDLIRSQLQAGSFTPAMFEMSVDAEYEQGTQFRGVVDRVDISEDTDVYVRIVDYKTYGKTYKVEDVYNGLSLQLGAYLGVVMDKLKDDFKNDPDRAGKAVKPAGVYYQTIGSRYNKNEKKLEASNELRGLTAIEALTRTDAAFLSATKSTVVDAAWDANKNKGSNVAYSDELENMVKFVQDKLIEIPREIKGGNVDLTPNEKSKPCELCDFKDVCRFTPGEFGTTWKVLPAVEKADMENAVFGRKPVAADTAGAADAADTVSADSQEN